MKALYSTEKPLYTSVFLLEVLHCHRLDVWMCASLLELPWRCSTCAGKEVAVRGEH